MKKVKLGNTGLLVSKLCFGTLPMGPLEANLPLRKGSELIRTAILRGINFIDTAHTYGTYDHIREAKKGLKINLIIASKTATTNITETKQSIETAIEKLEVDRMNIFLIHAARDLYPFKKYRQTLKILLQYKSKDLIQYVGIATHIVTVVKESATISDIDVIHPLINCAGLGIRNGTVKDMMQAINLAHNNGKGIYVMKPLAGGNLLPKYKEALSFVFNNPTIDSVAVGMLSINELNTNLKFFSGKSGGKVPESIKVKTRRIIVLPFCKGCGTCVDTCPNFAISIINKKAVIDYKKCIICGYCGPKCPEFALRVV